MIRIVFFFICRCKHILFTLFLDKKTLFNVHFPESQIPICGHFYHCYCCCIFTSAFYKYLSCVSFACIAVCSCECEWSILHSKYTHQHFKGLNETKLSETVFSNFFVIKKIFFNDLFSISVSAKYCE